MDDFGSTNVDVDQTSDTGRECIRYGLSSWSGRGSGVTGAGCSMGA